MIKLFGWESKATERMSNKREEELASIRTKNLLGLGLNMLKLVAMFYVMEVHDSDCCALASLSQFSRWYQHMESLWVLRNSHVRKWYTG